VIGVTETKHLQNLEEVLQQLQVNGLRMKPQVSVYGALGRPELMTVVRTPLHRR